MLKKFSVGIFGLLLSFAVLAQSPYGINYQGVARSSDGGPIVNQAIGLRISITQGPNGTTEFSEDHRVITNEFGLFAVVIGEGQSGDNLQDVDWAAGNKWLQIELDPEDDGSFQLVGTQQLMSVPYSLFSLQSADQLAAGYGINIANGDITNTLPDQTVGLNGLGGIQITGTYPNFTIDFTGGVDDADADPTNEIQTISKTGSTITLSGGGGSVNDSVNDADFNPTNEMNTGGSFVANNTVRITDSGGNTDVSIGTLNANLDANGNTVTNIVDPVAPGDAVSRSYLETVNATDYAFKTKISDTGTGGVLVFDLTNFDFDEESVISGNLINITEDGVYLFNVNGNSSLNSSAPVVINVNGAVDHPVEVVNVRLYSDSILLKLNAGDTVVLRANFTTVGEILTFEFFGFKI